MKIYSRTTLCLVLICCLAALPSCGDIESNGGDADTDADTDADSDADTDTDTDTDTDSDADTDTDTDTDADADADGDTDTDADSDADADADTDADADADTDTDTDTGTSPDEDCFDTDGYGDCIDASDWNTTNPSVVESNCFPFFASNDDLDQETICQGQAGLECFLDGGGVLGSSRYLLVKDQAAWDAIRDEQSDPACFVDIQIDDWASTVVVLGWRDGVNTSPGYLETDYRLYEDPEGNLHVNLYVWDTFTCTPWPDCVPDYGETNGIIVVLDADHDVTVCLLPHEPCD